MQDTVAALLLVLFLVHLAAFVIRGFRRREWYYLALVITFGLLSAAFAALLFAPDLQAGGYALHRLLRYAAWVAAAVSISWTALRVLMRRRTG